MLLTPCRFRNACRTRDHRLSLLGQCRHSGEDSPFAFAVWSRNRRRSPLRLLRACQRWPLHSTTCCAIYITKSSLLTFMPRVCWSVSRSLLRFVLMGFRLDARFQEVFNLSCVEAVHWDMLWLLYWCRSRWTIPNRLWLLAHVLDRLSTFSALL